MAGSVVPLNNWEKGGRYPINVLDQVLNNVHNLVVLITHVTFGKLNKQYLHSGYS